MRNALRGALLFAVSESKADAMSNGKANAMCCDVFFDMRSAMNERFVLCHSKRYAVCVYASAVFNVKADDVLSQYEMLARSMPKSWHGMC